MLIACSIYNGKQLKTCAKHLQINVSDKNGKDFTIMQGEVKRRWRTFISKEV